MNPHDFGSGDACNFSPIGESDKQNNIGHAWPRYGCYGYDDDELW